MSFDPSIESDSTSGSIAESQRGKKLLDDLVHEVSRLADAVEELNELERRKREGRK